MSSTAPPADGFDALRADGGPVRIRQIRPSDRDAITALYTEVSDRSIYLRFFSVSRQTAFDYLPRMFEPPSRDHRAVLASVGAAVVAVASFDVVAPGQAEVALLVTDKWQHDGIGTLLIKQLANAARDDGINYFITESVTENSAMTNVLRDLGYPMDQHADHGTMVSTLDLSIGQRRLVTPRDQNSTWASPRI